MNEVWKAFAVAAVAVPLLLPARMLGQQTAPAAPAGRGDAQTPAPDGRGTAQPARGGRGAPQLTGRPGASVDITGYWISLVTEDWIYRMITPPKGDRRNIPVNAAGIAAVNAWDPAKDEAAGEQCKAYGAVGSMRQPGRLHITWVDDNTLKIETEAGTQTRLLRFGAFSPSPEPTWQGDSTATWEYPGRRGRGPAGKGSLKVVTTRLRPGYLQKNGVPYSGNATLTEHFSRIVEPNGDNWLLLIAIVEDAQYLTMPFIRSTHYKRLPDNFAGWEPEACTAR
jgi:hypothetical protein